MTNITRYTAVLDVDLSNLQEQAGCVGSSKKWYIGSTGNYVGSGKHVALPVEAGQKYMIKNSIRTVDKAWCAYLTDAYNPPYTGGSSTPYVSGYDRFSITTTPTTIIIPEGCAYLAISTQDGEYNNISWTLQQYAPETAPYTINGVKCFQVTETWDGEIDAGGIHIDDAYNLEDIQITGNDSAEQLSLLAQIVNIKGQIRPQDYEFSIPSIEYEELQFNNVIGGTKITKCYKCQSYPIGIRVSKIGKTFCNKPIISLLVSEQSRTSILNNLDLTGFEALFIITPIDDLKEGVLIALPNIYTQMVNNGYKVCDYIEGPGKSIIITDLTPTNASKFEATVQLVTSVYNPQYPRLISAGRYNQDNGLSSSIEDYAVGGYLHVSYGNQAVWSNYTNIKGDLNIHTYKFDNNSFYVDETLVGTGPTGSFTAESYFSIFGMANDRGDSKEPAGRIYHASFYQDGVLVADMYPAISSENVAGLYDIVRNKFFTPSNAAYTAPI